MNETQAMARAKTLAYLSVANWQLDKPQTVKELVK